MFVGSDVCSEYRVGGGPGAFGEITTLLLVFGRKDDKRTTGNFWDRTLNTEFLTVADFNALLIDGVLPEAFTPKAPNSITALSTIAITARLTWMGYPLGTVLGLSRAVATLTSHVKDWFPAKQTEPKPTR